MAKVVLGKRPQSFKRTVSFALPGEKEAGSIEVTFKYRTRSEHAEWSDKLTAQATAEGDAEIQRFKDAAAKGEPVPDLTQADVIAHQNAFRVRYLMDAVEGWNLDVPFDKEAVEQLVDELPAAVTAIVDDYRAAIVEGRLGN